MSCPKIKYYAGVICDIHDCLSTCDGKHPSVLTERYNCKAIVNQLVIVNTGGQTSGHIIPRLVRFGQILCFSCDINGQMGDMNLPRFNCDIKGDIFDAITPAALYVEFLARLIH